MKSLLMLLALIAPLCMAQVTQFDLRDYPKVHLDGTDPDGSTAELNRVLKEIVAPVQGTLIFPECEIQLAWQGDTLKAGVGQYNFCVRLWPGITLRGQGDKSHLFLPQQDPIQDMHGDDPGIFGFENAPNIEISHLKLTQPRYNRRPSGDVERGGTAIKGKRSKCTRVHHVTCVDGHNGVDLWRCHWSQISECDLRGALRRDMIRTQSDHCQIWANRLIGGTDEDGKGESNMGIRISGSYNTITGNTLANIWFEGLILESGGVDSLDPAPGRSRVAHNNTFTGNTVRNARWGFIISAGWHNAFTGNSFFDCYDGNKLVHPDHAHQSEVTIQFNSIIGNLFLDCGNGFAPMLRLWSKGYEAHGIERVLNNAVSHNVFVRTHQGPNLNHVIGVQGRNTDVIGNHITVRSSENQLPDKQIIGIAMRGEPKMSPGSGSRILNNRISIGQEDAKNIYGLYLHGQLHADTEWSGNWVDNTSGVRDSDAGITAAYSGYAQIRRNSLRNFGVGAKITRLDHAYSGNDTRSCAVSEIITP
jgi:parallel beta-helix repeat protein